MRWYSEKWTTRALCMAVLLLVFLMLLPAGCAAPDTPIAEVVTETPITSTPEQVTESVATPTPAPTAAPSPPCELPTIVPPTPPAFTPGYTELDPSTNLHVTGIEDPLDVSTYTLTVTGKVDNPLSLTYDELRCLPRQVVRATLICPGFFEDEATWAGASLSDVLDLAQVQDDAVFMRLSSAEGYSAYVSLTAAQDGDNLIAYEWEGEPLPVLHGFPVRAVFPNLQGNHSVKWLVYIEVS